MVYESCPGVPVSTDGYSLVNSVGVNGTDIVQLIAHPTRPGIVKVLSLVTQFYSDSSFRTIVFSLSLH